MEKRHILICGERGVGKTTLMEKLMKNIEGPIGGYITRSTPRDVNGYHCIYLFRASDRIRKQTGKNYIGRCNGREHEVNSKVFDTLGVKYLQENACVIVMDEIGFMEENAKAFCKEIFRRLDGDKHVFACVRAKFAMPFLDSVRSHPKAELYYITKDNRDELYDKLLPTILKWNMDGLLSGDYLK